MIHQKELTFKEITFFMASVTEKEKPLSLFEENKECNSFNSSYFQKTFIHWAGVTTKTFLSFVSTQHLKKMVEYSSIDLFKDTCENKLQLTIERITKEEVNNTLEINYNFSESLFGTILVASTYKGICYIGFSDNDRLAFLELGKRFPNAKISQKTDGFQKDALKFFEKGDGGASSVKLHIKGTDFQFQIWETLLKIPKGKLTTYGEMAKYIEKPKASRAVGTAIGANPIAFLIPCHRVVQSTGMLGGYMWGIVRKKIMIGWELSTSSIKEIAS